MSKLTSKKFKINDSMEKVFGGLSEQAVKQMNRVMTKSYTVNGHTYTPGEFFSGANAPCNQPGATVNID